MFNLEDFIKDLLKKANENNGKINVDLHSYILESIIAHIDSFYQLQFLMGTFTEHLESLADPEGDFVKTAKKLKDCVDKMG